MKKKYSLRSLFFSVLLGLTTLLGALILLFNIENIDKINWRVIITFIVNGLIIFINILQPSKSPYRLIDILNVFMFIFIFTAPLIQYIQNHFPWWDTHLITDEKIILGNLIISLFLVIFYFFYSNKTVHNSYSFGGTYIKNINLVLDVFWILSILTSSFIFYQTGFINLFARSTNSLDIGNQSISLVVNYTFRAVPVIYVGLSLLYSQKRGKTYKPFNFFIGLLLMILTNFPTGLARFWIGTVYIGIIVIILKNNTKTNIFKIILFFGMLVIFPAINSFRNLNFKEALNSGIDIPPLTEYFLAGDFDSYSMLVRAIVVVEQVGFSWGRQLLGSIFFFVPRSIWPTKPIGSGYTIANLLGWNFTNVSMNLIGESYLNFGILGVVVLASGLGILLKKMDISYFYRVKEGNREIHFIEIIYPFTLGFLFFILRGDLLSSWAFYIGFMVPIILLYIGNKISLK